jgi:hypothetical protein
VRFAPEDEFAWRLEYLSAFQAAARLGGVWGLAGFGMIPVASGSDLLALHAAQIRCSAPDRYFIPAKRFRDIRKPHPRRGLPPRQNRRVFRQREPPAPIPPIRDRPRLPTLERGGEVFRPIPRP